MEIAQTADYALRVLDALDGRDNRTVAELAKELDVSRSVAQRVIMTLHRRGMVIKTDGGRYALGPALIHLAENLPHPLAAAGQSVIDELSQRTGETVVITVPIVDDAVVVASCPGRRGQLRVEYETGFRHPLVRGASGIAILAFLPEKARRALAGPGFEEKLSAVRESGIARTSGQIREYMVGMAAPIRDDRVIGSVAIISPSTREKNLDELADPLRAAAQEIEQMWRKSTRAALGVTESGNE